MGTLHEDVCTLHEDVCTLHEDVCTFVIISHSVLIMRNISDKSCRENQNTHFMSSSLLFCHAYHH